MPLPLRLLPLALAASFLATACAGQGEAVTSAGAASAFGWDTRPESGSIQGAPSGVITDIGYAQNNGFTRIVFEMEGTDGVPGYDVRYEPGPFRDMYDQLVPVAGTAYLRVHLNLPRPADPSAQTYVFTYTGSLRIAAATASVQELVFVDNYQEDMLWVIGLSAQEPFTVGTLTNPPRIYVDVED
jgi:hypothetical protein